MHLSESFRKMTQRDSFSQLKYCNFRPRKGISGKGIFTRCERANRSQGISKRVAVRNTMDAQNKGSSNSAVSFSSYHCVLKCAGERNDERMKAATLLRSRRTTTTTPAIGKSGVGLIVAPRAQQFPLSLIYSSFAERACEI